MNVSAEKTESAPTPPASNPGHTRADQFPWKLFLAALAIIIGGHVFSVTLHEQLREAVHHLAWATGFFVVALGGLLLCAWTLYRHRLTHEPLIIAAVLALLCGHWLALDTHHLLVKQPISPWLLICGGVGVVGFAAWAAHHLRHDLEMGRSLFRVPAADHLQHKLIRALVIIVSKPNLSPTFAPSGNGFPVTVSSTNPPASAQIGGLVLRDDIASVDKAKSGLFWNWQQLLRGIEPHQHKVERVWLVGSDDRYLRDARQLVAAYLPQLNEQTLRCAPAVDLEKFDDVLACLRGLVVGQLRQENFQPHEIAVDITGGIKIASVAGAVLTLNQAVVCQYVQTDGLNDKGSPEPYIYDFRWDKSLVIE